MAGTKIAFDLVSPEALLLTENADMVTLPGSEGEMGVLAGHEPLIATLKPGVIEIKGGASGDRRFFVLGGFVEVNPEKLIVLAEEAMPLSEMNAAELDQRIADTKEDLLAARDPLDRARLSTALDSLQQMRAAL